MSVLAELEKVDKRAKAKAADMRRAAGDSADKAILSGYLYLPRSKVRLSDFRSMFEYEIERATDARVQRQQDAVLAELGLLVDGQQLDPDVDPIIRTWSKAGPWWALGRGDKAKITKLLKKLKLDVVDKTVTAPLDKSEHLRLVTKLYPSQVEAFDKWIAAGHGMLNAAPAFGKTVVMINAICHYQQRTLVLVHTDELAEQFINRVRRGVEEDDGSYTPLTNCAALESKGKKMIGRWRAKKPDESWPITVATYQSFLRDRGPLRRLSKKIGLLLVDEAHRAAAPSYARIVSTVAARLRLSVSANEDRKDQLHKIAVDVIGPITSIGVAAQLPVDATMIQTGVTYKGSKVPTRADFGRMVTKLHASKKRNKLIAKFACRDVKDGRRVLILGGRINWVRDFSRQLAELGLRVGTITGGAPALRKTVLSKMVRGELDVIVATKVLDEGVDVKTLDTLYQTYPMSNQPLLKQRLGRIRRPYANKQRPLFRYFADLGHGMLQGCANSTAQHLIALDISVEYLQKDAVSKKTASKKTSATRGLRRAAASRSSVLDEHLFAGDDAGKRSANTFKRRMSTLKSAPMKRKKA